MPNMGDQRFDRCVIYLCRHSAEGAMGLVINRPFIGLTFPDLLVQLDIDVKEPIQDITIHAGGPVETGRGFVLHTADYIQDTSLIVSETVALTATADILRALADGSGPKDSILTLGYSGWASDGQLEAEIQSNSWLHTEADEEILFHTELDQKWFRAMAKMGVDISMLSSDAGHA